VAQDLVKWARLDSFSVALQQFQILTISLPGQWTDEILNSTLAQDQTTAQYKRQIALIELHTRQLVNVLDIQMKNLEAQTTIYNLLTNATARALETIIDTLIARADVRDKLSLNNTELEAYFSVNACDYRSR